jgi:uncharacterized protein YqgC (DUF456 family)
LGVSASSGILSITTVLQGQAQGTLDHPIGKGIILGASVGLIAGWFGMLPARALVLGAVCGLLAGVTRLLIDRRKRKSGK